MKRISLFVSTLILSTLLIAGSDSASAQQQFLYAADGAGSKIANLMILNPANGEVQKVIGPIGYTVTGLAFSPDGVLYGVTGNKDPLHPRLLRINTTTGAGTPVDPLGAGLSGHALTDIAFSPQGTLYGWIVNGADLAWVNETTGMTVVVAESGFGLPIGGGLSFAPNGKLYLTEAGDDGPFHTINTATGLSTSSIILSGMNDWSIGGLSINNEGIIYGVRKHAVPGFGPPLESDLITINPATGVITSMGIIANEGVPVPNMDSIAFSPVVADVRTGFWVPAGEFGQGSGVFIEIQGDTLALGWGAFDADGLATWVFSQAERVGSTQTFTGSLLEFSNGPTFAGPPAPGVIITPAGSITVVFTDNTTATMTGVVNGAAFNKIINKTFGNS